MLAACSLSQFASNGAAASILVPLAASLGEAESVDPRMFMVSRVRLLTFGTCLFGIRSLRWKSLTVRLAMDCCVVGANGFGLLIGVPVAHLYPSQRDSI